MGMEKTALYITYMYLYVCVCKHVGVIYVRVNALYMHVCLCKCIYTYMRTHILRGTNAHIHGKAVMFLKISLYNHAIAFCFLFHNAANWSNTFYFNRVSQCCRWKRLKAVLYGVLFLICQRPRRVCLEKHASQVHDSSLTCTAWHLDNCVILLP